jgi:hypothetical protein
MDSAAVKRSALTLTLPTLSLSADFRFQLVPALSGDIEQIARWHHEVLDRNDPFYGSVFSHPERADQDIPSTVASYADLDSTIWKAVLIQGRLPHEMSKSCESVDPRMLGFIMFKLYSDPGWAEEDAYKKLQDRMM